LRNWQFGNVISSIWNFAVFLSERRSERLSVIC